MQNYLLENVTLRALSILLSKKLKFKYRLITQKYLMYELIVVSARKIKLL